MILKDIKSQNNFWRCAPNNSSVDVIGFLDLHERLLFQIVVQIRKILQLEIMQIQVIYGDLPSYK
uniref:Uncharacterized protein n=1 Tax=Romanomermis culicivorax TaxID=13658 RepID=A0A915L4Y9_ROMCU